MNKIIKYILYFTLGVIIILGFGLCLINNIHSIFPIFANQKNVSTLDYNILAKNHITETADGYEVIGDDVYIICQVDIKKSRGLKVKFDRSFSHAISVQIFYADDKGIFSEDDSIRTVMVDGENEVTIPVFLEEIRYLRIDVEADTGERFLINDIAIDEFEVGILGTAIYMIICCFIICLLVLFYNKKIYNKGCVDKSDSTRITIYNLAFVMATFVLSMVIARMAKDLLCNIKNIDIDMVRTYVNPILVFVIITIINLVFYDKFYRLQELIWEDGKGKKIVFIVYFVLLIMFVFQMKYYVKNAGHFPDEIQHIGYVAYIKETHKIIPEFENMYVLNESRIDSGICVTNFTSNNNYLGHPPLYYWMMQLAGGVEIDGSNVIVNVDRLRNFSQFLAVLGMVFSMYIGLTRINKPILQCLYGVILVCLPNFTYGCAGVNNDTLTLLSISIFFLGIIRYFENKNNLLTFYLVAIGLSLGLLTKMTVGAIMIFSILFTVLFTFARDKHVKNIFNMQFLKTCWLYVSTALYFVVIFVNYGTIQPSLKIINYEQYINSGFFNQGGTIYSLQEYFEYFMSSLRVTWVSVVGNGFKLIRSNNIEFWNIEVVGLLSVIVLALIGVSVPIKKKGISEASKIIICGTLCALIYHFITNYKSHLSTAYLGACNSRYYFCCIIIFSMMICALCDKIYENKKNIEPINKILSIIICIISIVLIYDAYIYIAIHL